MKTNLSSFSTLRTAVTCICRPAYIVEAEHRRSLHWAVLWLKHHWLQVTTIEVSTISFREIYKLLTKPFYTK